MEDKSNIEKVTQLLEEFSQRTGISGEDTSQGRRYLWTDAFAVQAFFGLSPINESAGFDNRARKLIELVHQHLGQHHPKDERESWISGLIAEKAALHPTVGGLRIGKKLPERKEEDSYDSQLEWERDGQYFHYLTRWIPALLQAANETGEEKYAVQALELMLATEKFIYGVNGSYAMYWKMDTELTRPLVASMGAHDPLDGLICAKSITAALPGRKKELESLTFKFEQMCRGRDWATSDALGIGGLLLNAIRAAKLSSQGLELSEAIRPQKLWKESLSSLEGFMATFSPDEKAERRLAFRECGLSLGIRTVQGEKDQVDLPLKEIEKFVPVAAEIENFWLNRENRKISTWMDHLDINAVSLAASIVAEKNSKAFAG